MARLPVVGGDLNAWGTILNAFLGVSLNPDGTIKGSALAFTVINVKSDPYNAIGDNSADDTNAIQSAINALPNGGTIYFPPGTYKTTSGLTVVNPSVQLVGSGRTSSIIQFQPSAGGTALKFQLGAANTLINCGLHNLGFKSTNTTLSKIAIDLVDVESFSLSDIQVGGSDLWTGSTSIGLRVRGRQTSEIRHLLLNADIPLDIQDNPNSTNDIDHFTFQDMYLLGIGTTNPLVRIGTGVNLTDVKFIGHQAWVNGSDGLQWLDTTSTSASSDLTLEGIRWEQGGSGYLVDLEHNFNLNNLTIRNSQGGGPSSNGYKLRKVLNLTLDNLLYTRAGGEALNVDSTVKGINIRNCFWQAGATSSISGQRIIYATPVNPNATLPPNAIYNESASAALTTAIDTAVQGSSVTIAQDATAVIGTNALRGLLMVVVDENASGIYALTGTTQTTIEVADPSSFFTPTAGSALQFNIYWDGSNFVIQNKRVGSHNVRWFLIGTHSV